MPLANESLKKNPSPENRLLLMLNGWITHKMNEMTNKIKQKFIKPKKTHSCIPIFKVNSSTINYNTLHANTYNKYKYNFIY